MSNRGSRFHYALNAGRWQAARRAALARDGYRCTRCKRPGRLEVHHVKPLGQGGAPYALGNLATLCRGCHIKHHRTLSPDKLAWKSLLRELITA